MSYEVIRTIKGRDYKYRQESYRENGKVKTRYEYLGPVSPKRKRGVLSAISSLFGELDGMARTRKPWEETEEQALDRAAKQAAEYHLNDWMREKLKAGLTPADIDLIARYQHGELKLRETAHRHWELMPPETEERAASGFGYVRQAPEDSPAYRASQEAEQRFTSFMLGESEPAAEPEPDSGGAGEPPSDVLAAVAAPEPSGGDSPSSETALPSEPTESDAKE